MSLPSAYAADEVGELDDNLCEAVDRGSKAHYQQSGLLSLMSLLLLLLDSRFIAHEGSVVTVVVVVVVAVVKVVVVDVDVGDVVVAAYVMTKVTI
eukprot:3768214-Amphidinium_carterae.1